MRWIGGSSGDASVAVPDICWTEECAESNYSLDVPIVFETLV